MPHIIRNDQNGMGVVITLYGQVDGNEIFNLNEELLSDKLFSRWQYQIWDFSGAEKFDPSFDELRNFAIQDAKAAHKNPHQRIAIIPRKRGSSHKDGIFHVYEQVWGAYESRTFTSLESAREWAIGNSTKLK